MSDFVKNFLSANNDKVNSPTVIATIITVILAALAIPVTILGMFAVHHHIWVLKKGLDNSVTTLLLGLAGGGGIGMGAGYAAARLARGPLPAQGERDV
jgi:hypothetical protein